MTAPNARRKRGSITSDDVVTAAMAIVDGQGVPALTIRRLAQDLGVSPMALYRHVRDKDELLDRVVDEVAAKIGNPPAVGSWDERVAALFRQARRALLDHPGAALVAVTRSTPVPAVAAFYDNVLAILDDGGFGEDDALLGFDTLLMFLFGSVLWESPRQPTERGRLIALASLLDSPPSHLLDHASRISHRDPALYFEYGLDLIIRGMTRGAGAAGRRSTTGGGSGRRGRRRRSS